ncbi:MAG: high-affinity branched-chain amino acid ABC transporter permease LivM [Alphaproteobacteria bacterium]
MAAAPEPASRFDIGAALKEAGIAAAIALGLAIPLVGFQTVERLGGLTVDTRFGWVAVAVVGVFVGRLLLIALRGTRRWGAPGRRRFVRLGEHAKWQLRLLGFAGVAFGIALPFLPFADRYYVDLATTVLIYVMLGWGLNIVVGLAGLLDLGYVAFYAIGAYSFALFALHFDLSFWAALPVAGILAAFLGIILGFPVLRLRGDYLAIVTLGFGEIIRIVLLNWYDFTGGPNGLSGIPRPTFFGIPFTRGEGGFADTFGLDFSPMHRLIFLYYVILVLALITNLFTLRIRRLPVGRAWEALREDEIACRALGINPTMTKLSAFAIGAMFGGFAGAFFATRQGFISPESFTFLESALILAVVVLGGMGSQTGVVIAALFLVLLPEFARELAQFRMLLFGGAMVLIMVWRPRGLLAHREPTITLGRDPPVAAERPA